MYGKAPKIGSSNMTKAMKQKAMPMAIMVAVSKPKSAPVRGERTATNMMKKAKRGK
jgi:hypothetical protein